MSSQVEQDEIAFVWDDRGTKRVFRNPTIMIPAPNPPIPLPAPKALERILIPPPNPAPSPIEFVYEEIEIPPRPAAPPEIIFEPELLETPIPPPSPPAPLPVQKYATLEYRKNHHTPYFRWEQIGRHALLVDYIVHTPHYLPDNAWITPNFSLLIRKDLVEIWGTRLFVEASGEHPPYVATHQMEGSSSRPRDIEKHWGKSSGFLPKWKWVLRKNAREILEIEVPENELCNCYLEFEEILIGIKFPRKIFVWDAPLTNVNELGRIFPLKSKPTPRPFHPKKHLSLVDNS